MVYHIYYQPIKSVLSIANSEIIFHFNGNPISVTIDKITKSSKSSIILTIADPFYHDKYQELIDVMANSNKKFYILTLEYKNYWLHDNVAILSYPVFYFSRQKTQFGPKTKNLEKAVSCLNRMPSAHRILLGIHLYNANLLDKLIWSQGLKDNNVNGYAADMINKFDPDRAYRNLLPIYYDQSGFPHNDHSTEHPAYTDCYCNIVSETEIEYFYNNQIKPVQVITEKSYKPFLSCQLPIFYASPGHYNYLRELGFEPMEDLIGPIDHMGCLDKCLAICNVLSRGKDYFEDYYFTNLDRIQHNHQLVNSNKVDNKILQDIKDFLE